MADKARIFKRADREITAGNLLRAKEILQGNIGTLGYDPDIYEKYGIVLEKMGEHAEAGRFLFLSGAWKKEHEKSISLFLDQHKKGPPKSLVKSFPAAARLKSLSEYPKKVEERLRSLGVDAKDLKPGKTPGSSLSTWRETHFLHFIIILAALCILFCLILGVKELVSWMAPD